MSMVPEPLIRLQLGRLQASRALALSPRLRELLQFLVDPAGQPPEGHSFDRLCAEMYAPRARSGANCLRLGQVDLLRLSSKLDVYYQTEGRTDPLRIFLDPEPLRIWYEPRPEASVSLLPSDIGMAVLPFLNVHSDAALTTTPGEDLFATALTGQLIFSFTRIPKVKVVGMESVFRLRGTSRDARNVAQLLGVQILLEGSVTSDGDRLKVIARLSDAGQGWLLWSEVLEAEFGELPLILDEIVAGVSDALHIDPLSNPYAMLGESENLGALLELWRGLATQLQRTSEAVRQSNSFLLRAVEAQEDNARAFYSMAINWVALGLNDVVPASEAGPQAKKAAERAMELDPELPETFSAAACVASVFDWDWERGDSLFQESIRMNPLLADTHHFYASYNLLPRGLWDEARDQLNLALELDPLSPMLIRDLGLLAYFKGDYVDALKNFRRAEEMEGSTRGVAYWLGRTQASLNKHQEAIDTLESRGLSGFPNPRVQSAIAYVHAKSNWKRHAEQVMKELKEASRKSRVSPLDFAFPLIGLGKYDEALSYLKQAALERTPYLALFRVDPIYDPLRSDPRVAEIYAALGLTPFQ